MTGPPEESRRDVARLRAVPDFVQQGSAKRESTTSIADALELIRTTVDALLDPLVRLSTVRDPSGRVVDFVFREVNRAACEYLSSSRDELLGASLVGSVPDVETSGLLAHYVHCVETGEAVVLNDFDLYSDFLAKQARYDIQATRSTDDSITLTWRDVTEHFEAAARMAQSEEQFRLLAENSGDMVTLIQNGKFVWVSPAAEQVLGAPPEYWQGRNLIEVVPPEFVDDHRAHIRQLVAGTAVQQRVQMVGFGGVRHWVHISAKPCFDLAGNPNGTIVSIRLIDSEVAAEQAAEDARAAQARTDARYRRLMESSSVGMCVNSPDGRFLVVNEALCTFFGYDAETLCTMSWLDLTPPRYREQDEKNTAELVNGKRDNFRVLKRYVHADGHPIWADVWAGTLRDSTGRLENFIAQIVDVTEQIADRRESERARRLQAEADLRYRRLMENSAIGISLVRPDGTFELTNRALCDFFGYDAETLSSKTWRELIPDDDLAADLENIRDMLAGRIENYRLTKRYIHADGHTMWGDLSVSCIRDAEGRVERFISQIIDVTAEVEARRQIEEQNEKNRRLTRELRAQTDRLTAELDSAAAYIESLLPKDLDAGPVRVTSRYQPSLELAGDSHDYNWIDDDHLIVYLLDVSGHGVAAALQSISVHNMLRSASLPHEIMLAPERLLAELNQHFQMDRQGGNYFTMWYGVYQKSTRTLRYASAGHPPALMSTADAEPVQLDTEGVPIGMFDHTVFPASTMTVPPGARILLYSDGVYEWTLPDGQLWSVEAFIDMCNGHAASAPDWSLDSLMDVLRARLTVAEFEDDCSMVLLRFD